MMLALRAEAERQVTRRGFSEWTLKNSHGLEWSETTHTNLCPQCFLPFTSYFYHHLPWMKLLWQIFDKLFYNAVFCTHIGFSLIFIFLFFFSKDHSLVLFTAVFYRIMKSVLDTSGVLSLLICVLFMCFFCPCCVLNLVCVVLRFRFNWHLNLFMSL